MNQNVTIAETIRVQLGGNRFAVMTGAKNWMAIERGLSFKIGKNARGVTHIRIKLNDADLYDMEFIKCRGTSIKVAADISMVSVDGLRSVFTEFTGMYTNI